MASPPLTLFSGIICLLAIIFTSVCTYWSYTIVPRDPYRWVVWYLGACGSTTIPLAYLKYDALSQPVICFSLPCFLVNVMNPVVALFPGLPTAFVAAHPLLRYSLLLLFCLFFEFVFHTLLASDPEVHSRLGRYGDLHDAFFNAFYNVISGVIMTTATAVFNLLDIILRFVQEFFSALGLCCGVNLDEREARGDLFHRIDTAITEASNSEPPPHNNEGTSNDAEEEHSSSAQNKVDDMV
ncbi:hypothetical protein BDZ97DRAFT_1914757 [Flammula alnicola]|nr:hypothetical protein BDZ97DRAFT_1914757 [Flammula alnicola]